MTTQQVRSFDGTRLAVQVEGEGRAVVLSHYLGGARQGWDAVAEGLARRFRVVRYDTRGHGESDAPAGPYTVEMLGRDALAVLSALELPKAQFVGVSQGGMAGMWLAANAPDAIDRLVLANTTPFIPNKPVWDELVARARAEGLSDIARSTIESWLSPQFKAAKPGRVEDLIAVMAATPVEGYAGACAVLRDVDLRDDLPRIKAETLVIAGAEDGPRGAAAPIMAEAIPKARLTTLPAAAHLSHIEAPEAFLVAVLEHLS